MDFSLGSDAIHDNPNEEYYWEAVRHRIMTSIVSAFPFHHAKMMFLYGESISESVFRAFLEDVVEQVLGYLPKIYDQDPVFMVARRAAEFAKRGGYKP